METMETEEIHLSFAEAPGGPGDLVVSLEELVRTRLAIQANSGFGKSRALRQLYEQTFGRLQQFVFDVEGEFGSLRERFDYLLIGDTEDGADLAIHVDQAEDLCLRLMELGASCIFDLSSLKSRTDQQRFMRLFLEALMELPRSFWRPILIGIDEAQFFAPERGSGDSEATKAIITVGNRGRKRGYCLVLAFQRISLVHKGALAELVNKMIGHTILDTDLRRSAKELGMDAAGSGVLKKLRRGEFYAFGPAFGEDVTLVRTGSVLTSHRSGDYSGLYVPPVASEAVRALLAQLKQIVKDDPAETPPVARVRIEIREIPIFAPGDLQLLQETAQGLRASLGEMSRQLEAVQSALDCMQQAPVLPVAPPDPPQAVVATAPVEQSPRAQPTPPKQKTTETAPEGDDRLSSPQQSILNSLMDFARLGLMSVSRSNIAVWSGASPSSGSYTNNLGRLRTLGLIDYPAPGKVALTATGKGRAKSVTALTSIGDLLEAWCRHISGPQGRIVRHLASIYPRSTDRVDLAAMTGASPTSGAYTNNLGSLRSLGLIDYPERGRVVATALLFPEGLRQ